MSIYPQPKCPSSFDPHMSGDTSLSMKSDRRVLLWTAELLEQLSRDGTRCGDIAEAVLRALWSNVWAVRFGRLR